jgi:hypothetical protein
MAEQHVDEMSEHLSVASWWNELRLLKIGNFEEKNVVFGFKI